MKSLSSLLLYLNFKQNLHQHAQKNDQVQKLELDLISPPLLKREKKSVITHINLKRAPDIVLHTRLVIKLKASVGADSTSYYGKKKNDTYENYRE